MQNEVRLNKFIAQATGVSRREADDIISSKKVTINGNPVEIGQKVQDGDTVAINGRNISTQKNIYLAFNKPVNFVCSRKKQGESPTIYSIIPKKYHHLKPVGRLDRNSSGLLILTNDGDTAFQMTHPKFHKIKKYLVTLDKEITPLHRQMISDFGIDLEDGKSQLLIERTDKDGEWLITMSEGRNRQIRRTFAALGYTVIKLHRIQFGNLLLSNLKKCEVIEIPKPN